MQLNGKVLLQANRIRPQKWHVNEKLKVSTFSIHTARFWMNGRPGKICFV
jgi:hypothetical protein